MIYSMRGGLIKDEVKLSTSSDTRQLLECCKSCKLLDYYFLTIMDVIFWLFYNHIV